MLRCTPLLYIVIASFLFNGCASRSPRPVLPHGAPFSSVEAPPKGSARLYVLRPDFTRLLELERPILAINGHGRSLLAMEQFDSFVLPPGKHLVSLLPRKTESSTWRSEHELILEPDSITFLALWNLVDGDTRNVVSVAYIPGFKAFLPYPDTLVGIRSVGVKYELVPQGEVLPIIEKMYRALSTEASADEP